MARRYNRNAIRKYANGVFNGRGVPRPNNDMDTMRTALAGEACLAPTKPCGGKAIEVILLPLQGAHELRLFIPKHHFGYCGRGVPRLYEVDYKNDV